MFFSPSPDSPHRRRPTSTFARCLPAFFPRQRCLHAVVALAAAVGAGSVVRAQGAVDPATVTFREVTREVGSSVARPVVVRYDASGNMIVGVVSSGTVTSGYSYTITYSSAVRKYSPQGVLLWTRSRNLTSVSQGGDPTKTSYFEAWGDGPTHAISAQQYGVAMVALAGLAVDASGNVFLAYDSFRQATTFEPGIGSVSQTVANNPTLYVKLSPAGDYLAETYSFPDTGGLYEQASHVVSFEAAPNGGAIALLDNYNFPNFGAHWQAIVQRISSAGSSVEYTTLYGSDERDAFGGKRTNVTPIALGVNAAGEAYVATNDVPVSDVTASFKHVLRRISTTGTTTARIDVAYGTIGTGTSGDKWSGLAVDAAGNCYVGASTKPDPAQGGENQVAIKFSADLSQQLWRTVVAGNSGNVAARPGIKLGSSGLTLVGTTNTSGTAGAVQWSVSRVSTAGFVAWHQSYAGPRVAGNPASTSTAQMFTVDGADNVFVSGDIPQAVGLGGVIGKFSTGGELQFVKPVPTTYSAGNISNLLFSPTGGLVFGTTYYNGVAASPVFAQVVLEMSNPAVAPGPSARLSNLSILTTIAAAGDNFTLGYVVGGAGTTGQKTILIRAAGPTLGAAPFNIPGTLADPKLELFAGTAKMAENDNWGGSTALTAAFTSVGAFPYTGATSLDAATVATVSSGQNSVRVSGNGGATGTVIAELYDSTAFAAMTSTTPRLINVSVLKSLGTGLTMGFVIDGSGAKKVLIRAVGPTLGAAPFNVPGVVSDPQLTLFSGQTSIGTNDNWGGTPELTAAFTQVGAFVLPATSSDAALLTTLQPGNYTVQVRGVGTATGVALVEVYEVP